MGIEADALFTKTQQRVLALLFGHPDRSYYANEIIKLAGSGSGAVQRELARLEAAVLVTARRVGNQKHYQANATSPIFTELCSLILKTFGVTDVLRSVLQPLFPHIDLVFIYGSMAKGTAHAGSDIDLMVIGTLPSNAALLDVLEPAQIQLGRSINPTWFTPAEFQQRLQEGRSFITRVLAQPKMYIQGSEHDLNCLASTGQSGAHRPAESGAD